MHGSTVGMFSASVSNRATRLSGWHLCGTVSALRIATGLGGNLGIGSGCVFMDLPSPSVLYRLLTFPALAKVG